MVPVEKQERGIPRDKSITISLHLQLYSKNPENDWNAFFLESSRNHRSNCFCRADAAEAGSREPPQLTNLRKICFCYFFTQSVATLKLPLSYTLVMNSFPPILRRMSPEFLPGPWTVLVDANHKALMQCIYSNHKGPSLCHFQATKDLLVKSIVNTFNNLQYHRPPM